MGRERCQRALELFRHSLLIHIVPTTGALGLLGLAESRAGCGRPELREQPEVIVRISVPRVPNRGS
jgi:hypothetical protein